MRSHTLHILVGPILSWDLFLSFEVQNCVFWPILSCTCYSLDWKYLYPCTTIRCILIVAVSDVAWLEHGGGSPRSISLASSFVDGVVLQASIFAGARRAPVVRKVQFPQVNSKILYSFTNVLIFLTEGLFAYFT